MYNKSFVSIIITTHMAVDYLGDCQALVVELSELLLKF